MSKYLLLSVFLLTPAFAACADQAAGKAEAPAAAGLQADAQPRSDTPSDQKMDPVKAYCVSQTGTHLAEKNDVCPYGVTVDRQEWENRGGTTTADFVRKGIP
jgi:hypothetical protein